MKSLCRALGFDKEQAGYAVGIFQQFASSWGARTALGTQAWPSDITDDFSPYEFSIALSSREAELRFLVEVQGHDPSLRSQWEAAGDLNYHLASEHGVHLGRFNEVKELFAPTDRCPRFALWHAVCFRPGRPADFKVYLNPQAGGRDEARERVVEAMSRLGFGDSCKYLPPTGPADEIIYFSLDLDAGRGARVKVYTAHHDADIERIDEAIAAARGYVPGQARAFCQAMGVSEGPYRSRPVITCLAFAAGHETPTTGTVHFPVRSYAPNDRVAFQRIMGYLDDAAAGVYESAIDAFSDRRLEDGTGMQTYASLRIDGGPQRVTVYLSPELYDVGQIAMTQPAASGVISRTARSKSRRFAKGA